MKITLLSLALASVAVPILGMELNDEIEREKLVLSCLQKIDPKKIVNKKNNKRGLPFELMHLVLTPQGLLFLKNWLPLEIQIEIAGMVISELPIFAKIMQKIPVPKEFIESNDSTLPLETSVVSPDGKYNTSQSSDRSSICVHYDGKCIHTIKQQHAGSVAFSLDSSYLAIGKCDKQNENGIQLWDAKTGKLLHSLEGCSINIPVSFSTNDQLFSGRWTLVRGFPHWDAEDDDFIYDELSYGFDLSNFNRILKIFRTETNLDQLYLLMLIQNYMDSWISKCKLNKEQTEIFKTFDPEIQKILKPYVSLKENYSISEYLSLIPLRNYFG